jgi:hypothetical protein
MGKETPGFIVAVVTLLTLAFLGIALDIAKPHPTKDISKPITQVVLDCNRPEGRKVWTVDSITFYKNLRIALKSGDVRETVDASNWLCSVGSVVIK